MFSTAIEDLDLPWNEWREREAIVLDDGALPVCTLHGGMKLTLLSPGPEQLRRLAPEWARELKRYGLEPGSRVDYSRFLKGTPATSTDVDQLADKPFNADLAVANGSSIAFLAEFGGASVLLAADAYAPILTASVKRLIVDRGLERLRLDLFKLPHHGSQNNLSAELLKSSRLPKLSVLIEWRSLLSSRPASGCKNHQIRQIPRKTPLDLLQL